MQPRRRPPPGPYAILPSALNDFLMGGDQPQCGVTLHGDVAVVDVVGPLESRHSWWCDSYDDIKLRVASSLNAGAKTLVLRLSTPGGVAAGVIDSANSIRAHCTAKGVRLIAYCDGVTASAGYALACVADEVWAGADSVVGSIGVVSKLIDVTANNEQHGIKVSFVHSGAKKPYGDPEYPVSPEVLAEAQRMVDGLAARFFDHVSIHRKLELSAVVNLQAGTFLGTEAAQHGLVDKVGSLDQLLAILTGDSSMKGIQSAIDALRAVAEGDDEIAAKAAKKALAALELEDGGEPAEDPVEEPAPDAAAPAAAQPSAEIQAILATTKALQASVNALLAKDEAAERAALMATRPDLTPEAVERLNSLPLATVRVTLPLIAGGQTPAPVVTAGAPTQGNSQPLGYTPDPKLAARMRGETPQRVNARVGNVQYIQADPRLLPEQK